MKTQRHFIVKYVFPLFLALTLLVPAGLYPVSAAIDPLALTVTLTNKLEHYSDTQVSDFSTIFGPSISEITQGGYDAFIIDQPLKSMWIDISNTRPNASIAGNRLGNQYYYYISSLSVPLAVFADHPDPAGMIAQVNAVIEGFAPTGTTLYEKLLSIHNYVCLLNTYDSEATFRYNAYGALVARRSVCEGYAEAFKLLCDYNGIDCVLVVGTANNGLATEKHMWNYVRMDDNRWYAVDATWDDANTPTTRYFLVGAETEIPYANVTFSQNHFADGNINDAIYTKTFTYPDLSTNSYLFNNPTLSTTNTYEPGQAAGYFYNQLSDNQRCFYDTLNNAEAPSVPGAAPTPAPTDDLVQAETTTAEDTTTETTVTEATTTGETTAETTLPDETTTEATTAEVTTADQTTEATAPDSTTVPEATTAPSTTAEETTETTTFPSPTGAGSTEPTSTSATEGTAPSTVDTTTTPDTTSNGGTDPVETTTDEAWETTASLTVDITDRNPPSTDKVSGQKDAFPTIVKVILAVAGIATVGVVIPVTVTVCKKRK